MRDAIENAGTRPASGQGIGQGISSASARNVPLRRNGAARSSLFGVCAVIALLAACGGTSRDDVSVAADSIPAESASSAAIGPSGSEIDATVGAAASGASGGIGASGAPVGPSVANTPPPGTATGEPVTIAFAGDITFEDGAASLLADDPSSVFAPIAAQLSSADLTVANLETAIVTDGGPRADKQFAFDAPPSAFDALAASGIDVVSMANNHGMDFGQEGLEQSLAAASEKGYPVIGIGTDESAAFRPFMTTINGQRIGVIGATQVLDGSLIDAWTATADHPGLASAKRVDRLVQAVTELRSQVDTLIVFLHWGTEKETCPNDAQKELAPQLVAAGADIVVGGHAHRVLSAGYLGQAYVGYGLGNFLFKSSSDGAKKSGVLVVTAAGRKVVNAEWKPARINGSNQPVPLDGDEAAQALAAWNDLRSCTGLTATPG